MKILLVIMTGIGFTLGVVFGLLLHLPTDSLPAQNNDRNQQDVRIKRRTAVADVLTGSYEIKNYDPASLAKVIEQTNDVLRSLQISESHSKQEPQISSRKSHAKDRLKKVRVNTGEKRRYQTEEQTSLSLSKQAERLKLDKSLSEATDVERDGDSLNPDISQGLVPGRKPGEGYHSDITDNSLSSSKGVRKIGLKRSNSTGKLEYEREGGNVAATQSLEDELYLSSVVRNVYWTEKMEQVCRKPFMATDTESWRTTVQGLDVVKMETGCGRMQNRLLTFRDASKACARYRLNTDQIQGDIFSYYLAKLLNISNLPPTILASVNSVEQKWKTVHLDLSLAQWADSKLVVLTRFIEGLQPAHIPKEFRDERRQLSPTFAHLGAKSQADLCELMQWSDLIVFDYLTANLDRVINNMFNSQWNDQMMASPTHNLEQFTDGRLVFLDNESGLFHGFRLIDKYEKLHRALLDSVCVFRSSTAEVVKRLATSGSVGKELRDLLEANEPLARHVPSMPSKNVKVLERRIQQVYKQIVKCEKEFNSR